MTLSARLQASPVLVRVAPFLIFLGLTALQGVFGEESRYWCYALKTAVGAVFVWIMYRFVREMRWQFSWEAVAAGLLVLGLWVALDPYYPKLGGGGEAWNPLAMFPDQMVLAWFFIVLRIAGSTLVVPPLEEVFYRSFLYRYFIHPDFEQVALKRFHWLALIVTSVIFGLTHYQWLAGILCGLIYQSLVIRKGRLGDAMTAHAITNCLLGIWVVGREAWRFW